MKQFSDKTVRMAAIFEQIDDMGQDFLMVQAEGLAISRPRRKLAEVLQFPSDRIKTRMMLFAVTFAPMLVSLAVPFDGIRGNISEEDAPPVVLQRRVA
jgi:hypothetical protein